MVREFAKAVHGRGGSVVFVNQTKPPDSIWGDVIDFWIEWDCDAWVADLKSRREDIWLPQGSHTETPKEEKPQSSAKNPMATRPDVTNGAYLTWKILGQLRKLTGQSDDQEAKKRIERLNGTNNVAVKVLKHMKQAASKPAPVPAEIKEATQPIQEPIRPPASEDSCAKRKRKSLPRPNAVREDKLNGAYLTFSILRSLRILNGRETPIPFAPASSLSAGKQRVRMPLSKLSPNTSSARKRPAKDKAKSGLNQQIQLPTPPTSDGATPTSDGGTPHSDALRLNEPPMTPKTERIKRLGSISAILSSPLSSRSKR
jgi:NAD-dependent histone deacetylase SIR2